MEVYKITFTDNTADRAILSPQLKHGDKCFNPDNAAIEWIAVEAPDKEVARERASRLAFLVNKYALAVEY